MHDCASIRVASLNLLGRKGQFGKRMDVAISETKALAPDVLFLQEVLLKKDYHPLLLALEKSGYVITFRETLSGEKTKYGNAIASKPVPLDVCCMKLKTPISHEKRNAVGVKLQLGGARCWFVCTHLSYDVDESVRCGQIKEILTTKLHSDFSVFGGDFNMPAREVTSLTLKMGAELRDTHPEAFWDEEYQNLVSENPISIERGITKKIDHLLYRSNDDCHIDVEGKGFFATSAVEEIFPSDHIGVFADFSVRRLNS